MYSKFRKFRQDFEVSFQRAKEARKHGSRHTFIEPESLMGLIIVHRNFRNLLYLIDQHWEAGQKEEDHSDRDLWLWSQALGWTEQDNEYEG